jgi:hypothetical protein
MTSKYKFFQKIDQLPRRPGMKWMCETVTVVGDILGEDGQPLSEKLELWRRDPVECVRELIGNPEFRDAMAFAPERHYSDENGKNRIIDEMWTADWWWKIQVRIRDAMIESWFTLGSGRESYRVEPLLSQ